MPAGLFSILTSVWDGSPLRHLRTLAESIAEQNRSGASEWVILDNGCRDRRLLAYLQELSGYRWVKPVRVQSNAGIVRGLRLCLEQASGRYVLPVDADDVLYRDALQVVASAVKASGHPALLYTDEDKILGSRVYQPYFKPDWDPVLLLNSAYIAHLVVMDRAQALELDVYGDPQVEGSPDWDAFVRFLVAGKQAVHIPEVVYSWRVHAQSTADDVASKPYIHSSQAAVLQRFLDSDPLGSRFEVAHSPLFGGGAHFRILRRQQEARALLVTVRMEDPRAAANSLRARVEGVAAQQGFVHLVGGDLEIDSPEWQWEAQGLFELHPDVVMIGGRIRNRQGSIRDAGRYFGFGGVCGCPYRGVAATDPGYFGQLWKQRSVSAVATQFAVMRAEFLLELLKAIPQEASLGYLGVWAGAQALRTGKRVVYSPFLSGTSEMDWDVLASHSEVELFKETYADVIPDRRFYSANFSLRDAFQVKEIRIGQPARGRRP